jgi:hypothetical protein
MRRFRQLSVVLILLGVIPLLAARNDKPSLPARWLNRLLATQQPPGGGIDVFNSGYPVERSACLTIAIGPAAAGG